MSSPEPQTQETVGVPIDTLPLPVPVDLVAASATNWVILVPIIGAALTALVVATISAWGTYSNGLAGAKAAAAAATAAVAVQKGVDSVHVLVNSGLTKALSDVAASQQEARELRELATKLSARLGELESVVQVDRSVNTIPRTNVRPTGIDVLEALGNTPTAAEASEGDK